MLNTNRGRVYSKKNIFCVPFGNAFRNIWTHYIIISIQLLHNKASFARCNKTLNIWYLISLDNIFNIWTQNSMRRFDDRKPASRGVLLKATACLESIVYPVIFVLGRSQAITYQTVRHEIANCIARLSAITLERLAPCPERRRARRKNRGTIENQWRKLVGSVDFDCFLNVARNYRCPGDWVFTRGLTDAAHGKRCFWPEQRFEHLLAPLAKCSTTKSVRHGRWALKLILLLD